MNELHVLDGPEKIRVAGQQVILGTATGIPPGVITDKTGTKHT